MKNYGYDYKFDGRMKPDDFRAIKSSVMIDLKTKYIAENKVYL